MFPEFFKKGVKVISVYSRQKATLVKEDVKGKRWEIRFPDGRTGHILVIDSRNWQEEKK